MSSLALDTLNLWRTVGFISGGFAGYAGAKSLFPHKKRNQETVDKSIVLTTRILIAGYVAAVGGMVLDSVTKSAINASIVSPICSLFQFSLAIGIIGLSSLPLLKNK